MTDLDRVIRAMNNARLELLEQDRSGKLINFHDLLAIVQAELERERE